MNYKKLDLNTYYRKDIFNHFSKDCKCSTSITYRIDVTPLYEFSKRTGTKFYINFLYVLSKALNSREDYRMFYNYKTDELFVYDLINPCHYIFHEDKEIFSAVYSEYNEDYDTFYKNVSEDIIKAKESSVYGIDSENHPNWFDASYISWISYDSLNIELPDGYLYFAPIINWGRYSEENGLFKMPLTVRMNHAAADGYLISKVFLTVEDDIKQLCE